MGSFLPKTSPDGLGVPALDDRLAGPRTRWIGPGNQSAGGCHRVTEEAELLGLADYDHDAVRIITAARVRLRILRMMRQTPEVRDRLRRTARARDMLLQTVVELHPHR